MVIQKTTSARNYTHPALIRNFVIRDAEDAREMTSGSLSDLPDIDQGTAVRSNWEEFQERTDIGDVSAGATMVSPKAEVHSWVQIEAVSLDHQMAQLQRAADAGDERAYLHAENAIDWEERSAEDVLRGIRFALAAGAHLAASRIASQGASQFPQSKEVQRYARVLAPARVIKEEAASRSDLRANRDWLQTHRGEYQGKWVAIKNGNLLGTALSLSELRNQIQDNEEVFFSRFN